MIVFLDACVLIYWIEAQEPYHSRVISRMNELWRRDRNRQLALSRLSILECLVKPMREQDARVENAYREFFAAPDLLWVELTADVIENAARLRAQARLKTPDALQASSALSLGDEVLFLTNDDRFESVKGLNVVRV